MELQLTYTKFHCINIKAKDIKSTQKWSLHVCRLIGSISCGNFMTKDLLVQVHNIMDIQRKKVVSEYS